MDTNVVVRFVRDDAKEFVINDVDWGSLKINGVDSSKYNVYTESNGKGDGSTITGRQIAPRDLEFWADTVDTSKNDVLRWQALSFFNPKREYRIYITYMGRTRWISGVLTACKCPAKYIYEKQELKVYFICPDPYMNSVDDYGKNIAAQTPRWGFPYMDNPTYGVVVSTFDFSKLVQIDYDGDLPSYFKITMGFSGDVQNPKITKDNYFVRIIDTFKAGDVVEIDFAKATITKNGINILGKVDRKSNFTSIRMEPGVNTISYDADVGENELQIKINFYKKYLGV